MTTLPGILGEIEEVIGTQLASELARIKGGKRVRIPGQMKEDCWLISIVGREAAEKIVDHFRVINADDRAQGLEVVLPTAGYSSIQRARRQAREAFVAARQEGAGVRTATARAGLSERHGWRLAKALDDKDPDQGDLF